jgi:hypothetical protein
MRDRISKLLFYVALGLFFSHELDAVVQTEWRLLYVLRDLPELEAMQAFIWLHVPLFAIIAWLTHHGAPRVQIWSRASFSAFLVVHAILHFRLSANPLYTFDSPLSIALIYGGAIAGLGYLAFVKWSLGAVTPNHSLKRTDQSLRD